VVIAFFALRPHEDANIFLQTPRMHENLSKTSNRVIASYPYPTRPQLSGKRKAE
jgi:hypothetical protein